MASRLGGVIDGASDPEDRDDLTERTAVSVSIGDAARPINATDDELARVDEGLESAERGPLIDARALLAGYGRRS